MNGLFMRITLLLVLLTFQQQRLHALIESDSMLLRYARLEFARYKSSVDVALMAWVKALRQQMNRDTISLFCDDVQMLEVTKEGSVLGIKITPHSSCSQDLAWMFGINDIEYLLDSSLVVIEQRERDHTVVWVDDMHCELRDDRDSVEYVYSIEYTVYDKRPQVLVRGSNGMVYTSYTLLSDRDSTWQVVDVKGPIMSYRTSVSLNAGVLVEVVEYDDGTRMESNWTEGFFSSSWVAESGKEEHSMFIAGDGRSLVCAAINRFYGEKVVRCIQLFSETHGVVNGSALVTKIDENGVYSTSSHRLTLR